jgi:RNA polymerase-binding protein DksA
MDTIRTGRLFDQLKKRCAQVAMTLQYIEKERNEAEENSDGLDRAAHESRIELFDRLSEWYIHEIDEIDKALDRINKNTYGFCLACHNPIEALRLDYFPEAGFCIACQETRDGLQSI